MSSTKDIIGIVKELQEAQKTHDAREMPCCGSSWCGYQCNNRERMDANNHFPAIAEALLIAVEALEKNANMNLSPAEYRNSAQVALSRIRQL